MKLKADFADALVMLLLSSSKVVRCLYEEEVFKRY